MTRLPSGGPNLEFNFFWADLAPEEAFRRLVQALVTLGALFRRGGIVRRHTSGGDVHASGSPDVQEVTIATMDDVEAWLSDPLWQLLSVRMEGATATTQGVAEAVGYGTLLEDAASHDSPPLTISTEGQWTEDWLLGTKQGEQQARTRGLRAKRRFCALVAATCPSYASLTVEDVLPTPWALRRKPDDGAFRDFYVDGDYIGSTALSRLRELFADAYAEPLGTGVYVSTWGYFNPKHRTLALDQARTHSEEVARMIAHARRNLAM